MTIASIDPRNGETRQTFTALGDAQIDEAIAKAAKAFASFRKTTFAERAEKMTRAAEILEGDKEDLARTMTEEMGKTFASAVAEAEKCARACRWYAEHAERLLSDEHVETDRDGSHWPFILTGARAERPRFAVAPADLTGRKSDGRRGCSGGW